MANAKLLGGKHLRLVAGLLAISLSGAAIAAEVAPDPRQQLALASPDAARPAISLSTREQDRSAAAARFTDAPDGVDPMVTGPVSTAFRERQQRLNCSEATWPNVPRACYPE